MWVSYHNCGRRLVYPEFRLSEKALVPSKPDKHSVWKYISFNCFKSVNFDEDYINLLVGYNRVQNETCEEFKSTKLLHVYFFCK